MNTEPCWPVWPARAAATPGTSCSSGRSEAAARSAIASRSSTSAATPIDDSVASPRVALTTTCSATGAGARTRSSRLVQLEAGGVDGGRVGAVLEAAGLVDAVGAGGEPAVAARPMEGDGDAGQS